jgi:hypothetical protein
MENKTVLQRNSGVSTPNILAKMYEEIPPPYCRTRPELLEGFNKPGHLIS